MVGISSKDQQHSSVNNVVGPCVSRRVLLYRYTREITRPQYACCKQRKARAAEHAEQRSASAVKSVQLIARSQLAIDALFGEQYLHIQPELCMARIRRRCDLRIREYVSSFY